MATSSVSIMASPNDFDYHNYSEAREFIFSIAQAHPQIAKVFDIGDSWEKANGLADRDILALKISDNVAVDEDEPEVLVVALHHAREWPTVEIALAIAENLTSAYGSDARTSWLVDNREIWIVPVVNPDGLDYSMTLDDTWRKNRDLNFDGTYGVDLNRNYNGSQNGDPGGAWGGAGSSNDTSSEIYCGEAPFSEPETQAIRDLVLNRSFQIALDYHSYGDWVMWPWGYADVQTPDDGDIVRIGDQLAASNGYYASQSVFMYPTTGDSLDWLYGATDVYPFCFEVGTEFHPKLVDEVSGIVRENLPPAFLGIEIAEDREQRKFSIEHAHAPTEPFNSTGFEIVANITADRGVNESSLRLVYRIDGAAYDEVELTKKGLNDTYFARIPSQKIDSHIEYFIVARDSADVELMSPRYAPYELHNFTVVADSDPPVAEAGPDQIVFEGTDVTLNGSGSTDDKGIVSYTWTIEDQFGAPLEIPGMIVTLDHLRPFVHNVTLTVVDTSGLSDSDWLTVTVMSDLEPPVANAGDDQMIDPGSLCSFNGTRSTDNVGVVNYTWSFVYNGSLVVLYGPTPSFKFFTPGIYEVTLNVTDTAQWQSTDTMVVTVPEPISEYTLILYPVVTILALFMTMRVRVNRSKREI